MFYYIIRRIFSGVALLLLVSLATFVLFFASPADPARYTCGKNCTVELIEQNRKALGYDKPVYEQWASFVGGIFTGREFPNDPELKRTNPELIAHCEAPCLGYSPLRAGEVSTAIKDAFPVSASLALFSFTLMLVFGVGFGVIAALNNGGLIDKALVSSALLFYAFPTFCVGLILYQLVALQWKLVPLPQYTPIEVGGVGGWLESLILPGITLALFFLAGYIRITRAFVLETLHEDYLRTAKAKGLAPFRILTKHTMRAALTPIVTIAGLDFAGLLGGAIITEQVFSYPGMGKLAVQAATTYDLPTTVGIVMVLSTFVITANIVVDILYGFIDPRVKLA